MLVGFRTRRALTIFSTGAFLICGLGATIDGAQPNRMDPNKQEGIANVETKREITELLTTIRDVTLQKEDPSKVASAIERLGDLRARDAINDLVQLLAFRRKFPWETAGTVNEIRLITTSDRFPAVGALSRIGKAALPALLKVIDVNEPSSLESQNATEAVMLMFRGRCEAGITVISQRDKSLSDAAIERRKLAVDRARRFWCKD